MGVIEKTGYKSLVTKINFQVKVKNTSLTLLDFSFNYLPFWSLCHTSGTLLRIRHSYAAIEYSDLRFKM